MGVPLGKAIDLSRWLSGSRSIKIRTHRVGIELEGGWDEVPKGARVVRDGSVNEPANLLPGEIPFMARDAHGEIVSPILEIKNVEPWIRKYYPQHVNSSCGLHVHQSFESAMNYMRTMVPEFPATIIACMTDWATRVKLPKDHSLWGRLQGKSKYCQHIFHADEQATSARKDFDYQRDGHRYTVVNYPFARNGTMEVRLLPMMPTLDLSVSAVQEIIRITNAFLVATSKREQKIETVIEDVNGQTQETYHIVV